MAFPERVCLRFWYLLDRYSKDGAELGAEFAAYRLDLALGALLQDLDRNGVSPPQAENQDGSPPRGAEQSRTVQVLCPSRYFKELCTHDISIPTYPIGYDAGCAACSCESAGKCVIAASTAAARAACSSL
ncbi:hypothetical protein G9X68_28200 [Rhizobium sp. WYCCWR 11279]|uniref:Uncharacterized protein n=1 Tax=Rhizobium changzhiense TaxID=2692317 RepID=A0A7Z0U9U5_9HYPH|nr:hypothetical protein [Rhizobium changzhiense]NNU50961.1 hypothetical protein [Rhizobium changzhiense]NZD63314.1 hypothetical protein [Rhizobium changzhiense]